MNKRSCALSSAMVLTAALSLVACGDDGSADGEGATLVVLGSSPDINAAWQQNVDRQFEERTGATIEWLPGSAPTNLTKLITSKGGQPPADVVFLDTPTQTQAIQAGVLDETDRSKLKDSDEFLPDNVFANEGYGPASIVLRLGTCVNKQELEKAGVTLPGGMDSWFDPAIEGRFAMPDISTFYTQAVLPAVAEQYDVSFDDPDGILEKVQDADPSTFWTSSADVQQSLQSGEVWVTPLNDGRCQNLTIQGEPIEFQPLDLDIDGEQYPYVGLFDTWDIVTGTEKTDLAHEFMDIALNADSMSVLQQDFGYLPARSDVLEDMRNDPELGAYVGDYAPEQMYVPDYEPWFADYAASWTDAWNQYFKK